MDSRRIRRMNPVRGLLFALALWAIPAMAQQGSARILVQDSPLAGYTYHAAPQVWNELRVGDVLELRREPENPHDANAVLVIWKEQVLGYVPRRENTALATEMDRGAKVAARVSRLVARRNPRERVRFEVFVEL